VESEDRRAGSDTGDCAIIPVAYIEAQVTKGQEMASAVVRASGEQGVGKWLEPDDFAQRVGWAVSNIGHVPSWPGVGWSTGRAF